MKVLPKIVFPLLAAFLFTACNDVSFTGSSPQRSTKSPDPKKPEDPVEPTSPEDPPKVDEEKPEPPKEEPAPTCKDTEKSIGGHLAFLIDNSNSNAATDCPDKVKIGTHEGTDLYECRAQTNREKAVMAAFAQLEAVAKNESDNPDAESRLSIASFPTEADYVNGWEQQGGWFDVVEETKADIEEAMLFARKPLGLTPYGAAFSAGTELFDGLDTGKKAKVAVLVTDGEPTDQSPKAVAAQADALRASGVKVITVFVTGEKSRGERQAKHETLMKKIDDAIDPWFDTAAYDDFDAYINDIFGLASTVSEGKVVEVADSAALEKAFLDIVNTEVVKCNPE